MESASMSKGDRQAMMHSMMEHFFGGMGADEKKDMCATMMGKMTEGLDMQEMMPKMMMGMMSEKMQGGPGQHMAQMPEMMLKTMMPHCIGMMLPSIEVEKRGDVAAAILSAIVDKGSAGMSDEQKQSFLKTLGSALNG